MMRVIARSAMTLVLSLTCGPVLGQLAYGDDALITGQWYVNYLDLKNVHRISTGNGILVAIIDTGVDSTHPALQGKVVSGADFSSGGEQSTGDGRIDLDGHGTGMASLIAGHGAISGVAPDAGILPVRVMSTAGTGRASQVALGINWALEHGADVINISITSAVRDPRELAAVTKAISNGVVVVAGAGNAPEVSSVQYPARFDGVIAVAAVNRAGDHSAASVRGPELTLSAPGEKVSMADVSGRYVLATGTSVAAAIVSGSVALIKSHKSIRSPEVVIQILVASATDKGTLGRDDLFGFGIINPGAALANDEAANSSSNGIESSQSKAVSAQTIVRGSVILVAGAVTLSIIVVLILIVGRALRARGR